MKKRIVALVCVLTMLLSLLPTTALADGYDFELGFSAKATVGTTSEARSLSELRPGDIVTVKITVPGGHEFVAAQVKLLFDKDRFELSKKAVSGLVPTKTETTAGWDAVVTTQASIANANGYVSTTGTGTKLNEYEEFVTGNYSMPDNWDILTVTLKVKESAPIGATSFAIATGDENLAFSHEVSGVTTSYIVGVPGPLPATVVQELSAVEVSGGLTTPTKSGPDSSAYTSTNPNVDVAVSWDPALVDGKFAANTEYTATVTVTPKTGYIWASDAAVTDTSDSGLTAFTKSGNSFVATKEFGKTDEKSLTGLVITACDVTGKTAGDTLGTSNLTVKATYDDGSEDANFTGYEVVYTNGTALERGDTSVQVKSGEIVSAAKNFAEIPGKTAEASLFDFNAPALTYSDADQIDAVKSAAALKSAYTGKIGTPTITVKQSDSAVTEAKNAGSYDVYVSCAAGTVYNAVSDLKLGTVTISKADQTALTINCATTVEFGSTLALTTEGGTTGGAVTYTVKDGGTGAATIEGSTLTPTKAGTVKVTATMAGNDNYNSVTSAEFTVTITQKAITGATVTLAKESEKYTGSSIEVAVSSVVLGGVTLTTTDYDVSYENNTNVGTATVTVTGKGNYTGTVTKTFEITKADAPTGVKATFNVYYDNQNVQTVAPDNFNLPADIKNPRFKGTAGTASGDDILVSHSNDSFQLKDGVTQGKTASWTVTIESDNYADIEDATVTVTTVDVVFKVGNATASVDNAVTLADDKTYGQTWGDLVTVKSDDIKAWLDGTEVTGTYALNKTATEIPNAGDHAYNVIFTSTDGKYTNIPVFATDASITVAKCPVTVTAGTAKISKTYDATTGAGVLTGALEVTGILNADSAVVKVEPTSIPVYTSADAHTENLTLTLGITGDTNGNYALQTTSLSVPAEITKATLTGITTTVSPVTIKANDPKNTSSIVTAADNAAITLPTEVTVQYGAEKTTTLAIVWADATQTYNVKGNTYTFVGTTAASDNFSNRLPLTATLKVTPVTITAINGVPNALTKAKNEVTGSALTDVGFPAKVTLKFDSDVADMEIDATWNTAISALISAAGQVSSSNPSKTVTVTLTNTNFPAWATYSGTMPATSFTITNNYPVDVTVSVADKEYDGNPVADPEPTVTERDDKGTGNPTNAWKITYTGTTKAGVAYNSETAPKEAGDYTVTAIYDNGTHYGLGTDTFKITQKEAVLNWAPSSTVYDGTVKEVTVSVTNLVGSDVCTVTASGTKATEVGNYTATATGLSNANYKLPEVKTYYFSIMEPVITVSPVDAVSATRTGTTISVAGTMKTGTPVTVAVVGDATFTLTVEDGKVKTTKDPENGKFSIDVSGIAILPGNVTVENIEGTIAPEAKDALPQSVIDQAATAAAGGSNATVDVKVEVDGNALKGAYTVTVGSEKKAEGALTTLTQPVTVNLSNSFAANQFVKYTVGGKTQYLPTSNNGGKASFQTSDLTGTFEVVTNSDSVDITFNYFDGRVQTVTYTAADIGKALPTDSQSGCTFKGWSVSTGDAEIDLPSTVTEDLLKLADSTASPKFVRQSSGGGSSGGTSTYSITVESTKNGTVTPSVKSAKKGATVTLTVKPDKGFELDTLRVYDKDGNKIKVTEGKGGKYTFTMPASKVTVKATFAEIDTTWPFVDVADDFWARDAIAWAYENGYMNGNSTTTFNPGGSVTRQQLWMILARLSGERPASMAEAKAWAVENGISDGSNPGNAVSRQQMVTILYRYANLMGYKTSGSAALDIFPDSGKVAPYAQDAMAWSVANGIVGGTTQGTLNPAGTANRAQFATILQRFCKNIVEG